MEPKFITTDGFPIFVGDVYHIIEKDGISHWKCDEDEKIPTRKTYKIYETAQELIVNGFTFNPNSDINVEAHRWRNELNKEQSEK